MIYLFVIRCAYWGKCILLGDIDSMQRMLVSHSNKSDNKKVLGPKS